MTLDGIVRALGDRFAAARATRFPAAKRACGNRAHDRHAAMLDTEVGALAIRHCPQRPSRLTDRNASARGLPWEHELKISRRNARGDAFFDLAVSFSKPLDIEGASRLKQRHVENHSQASYLRLRPILRRTRRDARSRHRVLVLRRIRLRHVQPLGVQLRRHVAIRDQRPAHGGKSRRNSGPRMALPAASHATVTSER